MTSKKFLVPIDFSECSINALKYAINLAQKLDVKITIAHSVARLDAFTDIDMPEHNKESKTAALKQFSELKQNIPELDSVLDHFLSNAMLVEHLVGTVAHKNKTDLIIMGTRGASGILEEVLLNSNTFKVIKKVNCPVLAIPSEASFSNPKSIALAADYAKVPDRSVFLPLLQLSKTYHSEIHILNVSKFTRIGNEESHQARKFEQYFKSIKHNYHFEIEQNIEDGINNYLSENKIDLLTIVRREYKLLEKWFDKNITKKMVFHTHIPLLVLPDNAKS